MTDCSGTCLPSRYHHFASQRWQVENASSRPATVMVIEMRSPDRQVGQVPFVSVMVGQACPTSWPTAIAPCSHLLGRVRVPRRRPRAGCQGSPGDGYLTRPPAQLGLTAGVIRGSSDDGWHVGPFVANGPTDGRRHPGHMLVAEIQQVRVPFWQEITDHDLAIDIPERDRRRRLGGAPHLGACSHGRRLDHMYVIFKHPGASGALAVLSRR